MLSQISWPQFWMFMAAVVPVYYLIIVVVYFRSQAFSIVGGRFIGKKPAIHKKEVVSNISQVIGAFEEEFSDKNQEGMRDTESYSQGGSGDTNEISDSNSSDIFDDTYITDEVAQKINTSLLGDAMVSEDFVALVNAELENETFEQSAGEILAEYDLGEEEDIDAEDFFKLIEHGIEGLEEEKRTQIMSTALYQEMFRDSTEINNKEEATHKSSSINEDPETDTKQQDQPPQDEPEVTN
jgi:hypothetical protein